MKYILIALLVIHGLIHLLGFTKAFDLAQPPQLQAVISRPMGILWLAAALLLIASTGMVFLTGQWWWVPAAFGVVLSQILIFTAWNDAKVGTIANIILLFPIVVAALSAAPWRPGAGKVFFGDSQHYFAWLPAMPYGRVEGTLTYDGLCTPYMAVATTTTIGAT